ncbi:GNAT family N-acetyltransferase [Actinomadura sp. WMMB 499]|uniref:GNAT family N-acetyltransferase n=1 Tax=Actinomadura sp. WMMB 499 TaxID=1219491 RepID=UPI001245C40E|nr:GNAT family N-acetyltransferase [Actinomadura sp. WMMB 499]QFG23686.1 GNAT family N-acetyltransferase [Actinomadura sp. WMMB 499]
MPVPGPVRLLRAAAAVPRAREPHDASGWTAEVRRDGAALTALAADLRDLYTRCPAATPFQTCEWLRPWWDGYGTPGRLRLATVRRGGRLVAAAPLMLVRRAGLPVLVPLAAPHSDVTDILLDPAHADGAAPRLARALRADPGWSVLDLPEVPPGAAAHRLARHWPGGTWRAPSSICLELPDADVAGLIARLPGRAAGKTRARLRRIDRCGITVREVPPDGVADAVRELLDLHVRQWRGRPVNPEHTRDRFRRHLAEAAHGLARDGRATVLRYHRDGRLVAADLVLTGHRFAGAYLYGAVPDLRDHVDVGLMLLREDLAVAGGRGLSLLRGAEPYKFKWRPRPVRNERLVLGRGAAAPAYAALVRARSALAARRHPEARPHD